MIIGYSAERSIKTCTTENMIATALGVSMISKAEVVLVQCKYVRHKLEYAFVPYTSDNSMKEDFGYYSYGGIDSIINKANNNLLVKDNIEDELVCINKSSISYIPSTLCKSREAFNKCITKNFSKILDIMSKSEKIFFIELDSKLFYINYDFINRLDLLVCNLTQQRNIDENLDIGKRVFDNSVYLVGGYDNNSQFSIKRIKKQYGLKDTNIEEIPYNIKYKDSIFLGNVMDFFERNFNCDKYNENYEFITKVKSASKLILSHLGIV